MKFTSEDLMKAMGLQVGDRIKVKNKIYTINKSEECQGAWIGYEDENQWHNLQYLVNGEDYEILPRPKRVGDLKCEDFECSDCPLKYICCLCDWGFTTDNNLFNILEKFNCADAEIYDLLKARLDKVVE